MQYQSVSLVLLFPLIDPFLALCPRETYCIGLHGLPLVAENGYLDRSLKPDVVWTRIGLKTGYDIDVQ